MLKLGMKKYLFALFLFNNLINASFLGTVDIGEHLRADSSISHLPILQELIISETDDMSNLISQTGIIQEPIANTQVQSSNAESNTNANPEDLIDLELDLILKEYELGSHINIYKNFPFYQWVDIARYIGGYDMVEVKKRANQGKIDYQAKLREHLHIASWIKFANERAQYSDTLASMVMFKHSLIFCHEETQKTDIVYFWEVSFDPSDIEFIKEGADGFLYSIILESGKQLMRLRSVKGADMHIWHCPIDQDIDLMIKHH